MAPPAYIISRAADPIFALAIGISAAALRINREEKEKGKTTQQTIEAARRYALFLSNIVFLMLNRTLSSRISSRLGFPKRS
jgi:hypothetical protein